jgi:hypothetical protein
MEFLQLVSTIASNLTSSNVGDFISLVEGLVSLGENMLEHKESAAPASAVAPSATQS